MVVLVLLLIVVVGGYLVSLRLFPLTYCRTCGGSRRSPGSSRKRFAMCRSCGGTGRKRRLGARLMNIR